ncbi:MAG: hypothetical protein JWQ07_4948 [Ramlibacter sp.]|nr:hypothetical protein [Ramlibacter sp.]
MSTSTFLAEHFGVNIAQARDFVLAHQGDPGFLFNMAKQNGVTSDMLSEIVGGFSATQVEEFFTVHGLSGSDLHAPALGGVSTFMPENFMALSNLVALDTWNGSLSPSALRAGIVATTGQAAYDHAFDPSIYTGAGDGTLSVADLGFSHLGALPATEATMESLFFGTLIKMFKAIDITEVNDVLALGDFVDAHAAALAVDDPATLSQLVGMMSAIFQDAATTPVFGDADIAQVAIVAGTFLVQLANGTTDFSIFDGLVGAI